MNDPTATAAPAGEFSERERSDIELAQVEWAKKRSGTEWQGWVQIGRAIEHLRNHAKTRAGLENTNKPPQQWGKGYAQEFSRLLRDAKLDGIDKGTRSNLLECMDNLVAIEAWRATRAESVRLRLNHPQAVLQQWRASQRASNVGKSAVSSQKVELDSLRLENTNLKTAIEAFRKRAEEAGSIFTWSEEAELIAKAISSELSRCSVTKFAKIVDLLHAERVKLAHARNEKSK